MSMHPFCSLLPGMLVDGFHETDFCAGVEDAEDRDRNEDELG